MKKFTDVLVFTLCALALVAAQAGQASSKGSQSYPNELPTLRVYEQAKWSSLRPYVSTVNDIERVLGKPEAVYDELLRTYVAGFQADPDWTIVIDVVHEGGDLPDSLAGRLLNITLYPKKRIPLAGAELSAFRATTYKGRDGSSRVYHDNFGLWYSVYTEESPDGRFHADDLKWIMYGPSEEDTKKYTSMGKAKP